jgi:hypothetical protein
MEKVKEIKTPGWLYLENSSAKENKKEMELEIDKPNHGNIGKYMFFSDDKKLLIKIAKEILLRYNLFHAKVPLSDKPNPSPGFGFVLCIYDSSPKFKYELKQFADEKTIRYRYWKSDSATLDGQYSKEFLESQKRKSAPE